ncbi:MAG: HupE/UreJ family protein [Pseudomonadales bacterium]|nr:HupE/UreJ family protein [Pseudomonadales bacterium]
MRLILLFLLFFTKTAFAHVSGFTDSSIQIAEPGVKIIYTVPSDNLLELEVNSNETSEASLTPKPPEYYVDAIKSGWRVQDQGVPCTVFKHSSGVLENIQAYQYRLTFKCPNGMQQLEIDYGLFHPYWPEHRNYTQVFMAGEQMQIRLDAEQPMLTLLVDKILKDWNKSLGTEFRLTDPNQKISLESNSNENQADQSLATKPVQSQSANADFGSELQSSGTDFIWLGMEHIWTGIDHVVFVFALLLVPVVWRHLLLWISMFTIAHSITLALSYYKVLILPPSITEPLIALTVLAIGIENILALKYGKPIIRLRHILIPVFGLIHGVGFSYLLIELGNGFPAMERLFYFNLGVELGQLSLVALMIIPIRMVFKWQRGQIVAGIFSANIAVLGGFWLWQRTFM